MSDQSASIGGTATQSVSTPYADVAEAQPPAPRSAVWVYLASLFPVVREAGALALLGAVVLFSFRESITAGLIAAEKDTRVFFFPLHAWIAEEVKAGHIPLWNPYIFTGYPIFGDGEMGLASPLQLALLYLLPIADSFVWQRVSSVLIGAVAMYALCRALRLGSLAAILGGLTFGLGSFFPSQQHHENVTRTAAWLPLVLACVEWSLRRPGWRRHVFLIGAAGALGMAAVGLHPQLLAMTLLGFAVYVVLRVSIGPLDQPGDTEKRSYVQAVKRWLQACGGRIALIVWIGGFVGVLGLALAAVQLLPLAELGVATYRGSNPDYFFATSYALPVQNLVDLLLPYFFRGPDAQYWSLWAKWETTIYVGIAPLALAVLAIAAGRREVLVFAALAVGGLWLAFASYAPVDLYQYLWQLPGFSAFRVPGRYTYLFVFAGAVLAAFGLQALQDAHRSRVRLRRLTLLILIGALGLGSLALFGAMLELRQSLLADPAASLAWLQDSYLALRHTPEGLDLGNVYRGLVRSLSLDTPRTAFALITVPMVLVLAAMGAFARGMGLAARTALVGVTALDLVWFGMGLHTKAPVAELTQETPAVRFLERCATSASGCPTEPLGSTTLVSEWRVFTPGTIPSLEFDRLVSFKIEDVGGYSSVEPRRNYSYWTTIASIQNRLLDLANVRYVVYPARGIPLPSYRNVPFDPERPLVLGSKDSLGGSDSYRFGGETADRLQVVAALTRAIKVSSGEVVAELTIVPRQGEPALIHLRAGSNVAEWAYDRPDVRGQVQHTQPPEIAFRRPSRFELDGTPYELYLYYSEHDLPEQMQVERIDVRYVHPIGGIEIYGLGLYNFDTQETVGATQPMRAKLRQVHVDDQVAIMENTAAFPRAYVVPGARVAGAEGPLSAMLDGPFDPLVEVMLGNEPTPSGGGPPGDVPVAATGGGPPVPAAPLETSPERVRYRAASAERGYFVHVANFFPGWRAYVDGNEAPILLANGLFRAVPIGPGDHVVELRYEPQSVELGRTVSRWALLVGLLTVLGAGLAHWIARARR